VGKSGSGAETGTRVLGRVNKVEPFHLFFSSHLGSKMIDKAIGWEVGDE
jgi:hypothetical protein